MTHLSGYSVGRGPSHSRAHKMGKMRWGGGRKAPL
uniref:Uncharacterized protein n=1 Tax=Anguilla anguilla TaxID=7936 RepID=A0A0E9T396_ANGAN